MKSPVEDKWGSSVTGPMPRSCVAIPDSACVSCCALCAKWGADSELAWGLACEKKIKIKEKLSKKHTHAARRLPSGFRPALV